MAEPPHPHRTNHHTTSPFTTPHTPYTHHDTVFFSIYPDNSLNPSPSPTALHTLHHHILTFLAPLTTPYIFHHHPPTLTPTLHPIPHLSGHLRYGENLSDEWFLVYLLLHLSRHFTDLSIRVWDSDGEFLLIEAAYHLPKWITPENSENRVFIRNGEVHIVGRKLFADSPPLIDALKVVVERPDLTRASDGVQKAILGRVAEYPEKAKRDVHCVRVRVPLSVAQVLRHEPCLISLAVESFYDRDIDTMKYAAKMEKFLPKAREEELVLITVKMSRAMYAQLFQQRFQAPKCYPMPPMPPRTDQTTYMEAELGMKIACGFEMMYQHRKRQGEEGKGSTWEAFVDSFEKSGYFQGLLPGSNEYKRLMENVEEYYRKSAVYYRSSEILNAPVRRIDEILALPHSVDDFKGQEVPASDDDSWLYGGEEELKSVLEERQKEMELYEQQKKRKQKGKDKVTDDDISNLNDNDFDLGDIAKSMKAFVQKVSGYQGAEVPEDRDLGDVKFDVDRFMKELKSATKPPGGGDDYSDVDAEEGLSSDMDFDESEDDDDNDDVMEEPKQQSESQKGDFMNAYTDVLNEELRSSTLRKSFVRASDQTTKKDEGMSAPAEEDMDEDFTPVDVDVNLVQSLLESFSSQQGLPGPASNLLGLMGKQLPQDDSGKGKDKIK